jgi:hypothetical protein
MREAPMGAFGIVERFSTLRPDRLQAPVFDGVLDLAEWNGGSAIVHARFRYRALAALDLGKFAHQLPPAAVQIVLDRFALRGHAIAVHCAVQRYR